MSTLEDCDTKVRWRIWRRHASEVVVGGLLRGCLIFDFLLYLVEDTLVVAETVVLLLDGVAMDVAPTIESTYYHNAQYLS